MTPLIAVSIAAVIASIGLAGFMIAWFGKAVELSDAQHTIEMQRIMLGVCRDRDRARRAKLKAAGDKGRAVQKAKREAAA